MRKSLYSILLPLLLVPGSILPLNAEPHQPPRPQPPAAANSPDPAAELTALLRRPLTLDSAVRIALLNNRALQATFEDLGLSRADLQEARTLANPELDLDLKFPDRSPRIPLAEWSLAQNFIDLLLLPLRQAVAREQLAATRARLADQVAQTVAEVKIACLQVQADTALASQLAAIRDAERTSLEYTQKLHQAGNIPDLALLRQQIAYSDTRLTLARAAAEARQHRESLNRLLSLWGSQTEWKIIQPLPAVPDALPSVDHLESLAVAHRADLAASRSELTAALQSAGLARQVRFLGGLGLGVAGEHEPDGTNLNGPSLQLTLPLFQQGQAQLSRSQAAAQKAARRFEGLAIDIRSEVRDLRDQLISQADIAHYFRDQALPDRRKIVSLVQLNYNAMLTGAPELFSAQRETLEVERQQIEATRDYWITRARLERALGGAPEREW